ncbi:class I SAM-dependent methyltransferase [Mycolicibacterium litorale]|uniref:Methyltransferase n=1 Tax=Mycolicibacterium litorale TaxID=758802 RepID=A0AAD1IGG2_9MYCO|nr:methyltransferase [Mycolicibacterium litorale]MCV7413871.1 class I SAM-dependent methyltransferase [Mycolicibacterium litorale]TDY03245.1 methyltransferase family protein [Mycolicibacterium litorale]BBY15039.1 methyltransferase [Mycolicibacterium litorale]
MSYWNHNTAYHPWLVRLAAEQRGDALDVGCGDRLLAQRLAPVSRSVTAIDPDAAAVARAAERLAGMPHADVSRAEFLEFDGRRFDLITFVASLHHMPLRPALEHAKDLLRPRGRIAVVGLAANKTATDWLWSAMCLPAVRIASRLHHEVRDVGVQTARPHQNLDEIRAVAADLLPGASIRRGLYYRYLLTWQS